MYHSLAFLNLTTSAAIYSKHNLANSERQTQKSETHSWHLLPKICGGCNTNSRCLNYTECCGYTRNTTLLSPKTCFVHALKFVASTPSSTRTCWGYLRKLLYDKFVAGTPGNPFRATRQFLFLRMLHVPSIIIIHIQYIINMHIIHTFYTYMYSYAYILLYATIYIYIYNSTLRVCVCTFECACECVCICVSVCLCMHTCECTYECMYVCVCT